MIYVMLTFRCGSIKVFRHFLYQYMSNQLHIIEGWLILPMKEAICEKLLFTPEDPGVENIRLGFSSLCWFQLLTKLSTLSLVEDLSNDCTWRTLSTDRCLDLLRCCNRSTMSLLLGMIYQRYRSFRKINCECLLMSSLHFILAKC
jgi:hypothetical protein